MFGDIAVESFAGSRSCSRSCVRRSPLRMRRSRSRIRRSRFASSFPTRRVAATTCSGAWSRSTCRRS